VKVKNEHSGEKNYTLFIKNEKKLLVGNEFSQKKMRLFLPQEYGG